MDQRKKQEFGMVSKYLFIGTATRSSTPTEDL